MDSLLDAVPVAVVVISLERPPRTLFVNEQFVRTFGWSLDEVRSGDLGFLRAFPDPGARAEAQSWFEEAMAGAPARAGRIEPREMRVACKDGAARSVLASARVLRDRVLLTLTDVTVLRQAEERLRISEARHRYLADNARDVVWTMSVDGRITYVSPSVEAVRGVTPEEAMRHSLEEIHPPHSAAVTMAFFQRLHADIQAGRRPEPFRGEMEYKRKDGSTFWAEVMAHPITGHDGAVVEVLGVTRDLSDRKRLEEATRRAALGTLATGVAHEINNPLNAVLAAGGFAREEIAALRDRPRAGAGSPADEELDRRLAGVAEALADVEAGASRIARIVKDMAILARPDAPPARVRMADVVAQAVSWLPGPVAARGEVVVEDRGAPDVVVARALLVETLVNLLTNALLAIPDGRPGRVVVRIGRGDGGAARVEVADDGEGMTPEVMARAFDPFFTTRKAGKGTGLGLAVCRAIAVAHGGTLTGWSEAGNGSTFRLDLPPAPSAG